MFKVWVDDADYDTMFFSSYNKAEEWLEAYIQTISERLRYGARNVDHLIDQGMAGIEELEIDPDPPTVEEYDLDEDTYSEDD